MGREIITTDKKSGMKLIEILGLKSKCTFCNEVVTEKNFGGIFGNPNRISCNSLICVMKLIDDLKKIRFTGRSEVFL